MGGLLFSGLLDLCAWCNDGCGNVGSTSAMEEIAKQNPNLGMRELWLSGMRVGRDMMGTDSNTLILAFAGTSTSTLLL